MSIRKDFLSIKVIAAVFLGLIFPVVIILQSLSGLRTLSSDFHQLDSTNSIVEEVAKLKENITTDNDYKFVSMVYLENKNYTVMLKKQVMKIIIMQIGYATMSVGLMLIVLGFKDQEHVLSGGWRDIKIDFKTGSTGAAVVVVGAIMATLGGVLKNEYSNNPLPDYGQHLDIDSMTYLIYQGCKIHAGDKIADCFLNSYEKVISNNQ
ncbi:hypothetical protein PUG81_02320 [Erwiniaceae bacterium L1_54_6]|nr:hypothetical protein [Erwiniaceae bacterium L1_54_6]